MFSPNQIAPSLNKKTVYGVVILPDERVLLKRSLFETSTGIATGLWHTTVCKQTTSNSTAVDSLKKALFAELSLKIDSQDLIITNIASKNFESYIGEIILYTVRFTRSVRIKVSYRTQLMAMKPNLLMWEVINNQPNYMSDSVAAMELARSNWGKTFYVMSR